VPRMLVLIAVVSGCLAMRLPARAIQPQTAELCDTSPRHSTRQLASGDNAIDHDRLASASDPVRGYRIEYLKRSGLPRRVISTSSDVASRSLV
jgi:hypothetical protein